ncbi:MAG: T9SS type A sorting domain-containing protein [Bacteroidota bacterium]
MQKITILMGMYLLWLGSVHSQSVYNKVAIDLNPQQQPNFSPAAEAVLSVLATYAEEERGTKTQLILAYEKESPGGWHFTFRHLRLADNTPIAGSGIKANINRAGRIISIMDNLSAFENVTGSFPTSFQANLLSHTQGLTSYQQEAVYYSGENGLIPAYKLTLKLDAYPFQQEIILDANTQQVLQQHNLISGYKPYVNDTSAKGLVFLPDPITRARSTYGDFVQGNFLTDQFDANLSNLAQLRDTVVLQDVTFENGTFKLQGPYVSVEDIGEFSFPVATSTTGEFFFTRDQSYFEDVMCYYHIDTYQRYIQSLGFNDLHNYPVRVDAHGLEDVDGSGFFIRGEEAYILFGDGGVDDAEDADIIIHEYGHALSFDAIGAVPVGLEHRAVDEGICDYLAARYSQQLSDFEWFTLFNWDGHNEFWPGRVANGIESYPPSSTGVYDFGSVWSALLTDIHQALGGDITDRLILQEVYSNYRGMDMRDAALLLLDADSLLYGGEHIETMQFLLCQRDLLEKGSCLSVSTLKVNEEETFTLYPNPTTGTFYLNGPNVNLHNTQLEIVNMTGQKVYEKILSDSSSPVVLPSTLPTGIYQLRILEGNRLFEARKLVLLAD